MKKKVTVAKKGKKKAAKVTAMPPMYKGGGTIKATKIKVGPTSYSDAAKAVGLAKSGGKMTKKCRYGC